MSDVVSCPVLRHAHRDEAIERHSGTEHILRHEVVVARILLDLRCDFDESLENAFSPTVDERVDVGVGEVLLHNMHERVGNATSDLIWWNRVGYLWVEDRELWVIRVESKLLFSSEIGDYGTIVHLGTSGRHSHYRGKRDCTVDFFRVAHEFPSVAIVADSAGD